MQFFGRFFVWPAHLPSWPGSTCPSSLFLILPSRPLLAPLPTWPYLLLILPGRPLLAPLPTWPSLFLILPGRTHLVPHPTWPAPPCSSPYLAGPSLRLFLPSIISSAWMSSLFMPTSRLFLGRKSIISSTMGTISILLFIRSR